MPKALLIDDSKFMRNWLRKILEANDFEIVAEADNGIHGIVQYHDHQPDLVLMDVVMPKMNGVRTLEHLLKADPAAKVIICSSLAHNDLIKECAKIGAYDFVHKPFFTELPMLLNKLIQEKEMV